MPGWTVTPDYMASRLRRDPDEVITDAWIEERKTLVAIDGDRVLAAVHLHKYGDDTPNKGIGDVAWLLFWPSEMDAASSLLTSAQTAMVDWHVETEWIFGGGLPVPLCNGVPDTWPHITDFIQNAGYHDTASEEALHFGPAEPASAPPAPPFPGIVIQQDDGEFGPRFRVFSDSKAIGGCECVVDMTRGGQLPALRGWIELSEVEVDETYRQRGIGSWMLHHVTQWLADRQYKRVVLCVARNAELRGAGRLYQRFGWELRARQKRGWVRRH